jgi:hypothetical protein
MRSSSWFAMISNSSAVPLRPLAEMMPSSARCLGSHSRASCADGRDAAGCDAASSPTAAVQILLVRNALTVASPPHRSRRHRWRHSCCA